MTISYLMVLVFNLALIEAWVEGHNVENIVEVPSFKTLYPTLTRRVRMYLQFHLEVPLPVSIFIT